MEPIAHRPRPVQRIIKVRRDYNRWVADETLEDYALRFTPRSFRRWSPFRVANTAFGAVSFLALEAIGASITLSYGFVNAMWAIGVVATVIFLTGLPIAYAAARHGLDMDLLTRGAGFGYLGSTITSLIYAGFTFIFFALEAAIMAQAFELWFDLPRSIGYVVSALVIIPLVTHGITLISRLQLWTQPVWLILLLLPYLAIAVEQPESFEAFTSLNGRNGEGDTFSWPAFGAAATVAAALIAQIGEQVDFLRFMPEPRPGQRWRWWAALVIAGPGWIVLGAAKMIGGALLAFVALQVETPIARAIEPTQMYLNGFSLAVGPGAAAVLLTGAFVLISQVKINVTNAYAGSLAWSNFFARITHSHPGRVVWLIFNVLIAVLLMAMGVFEALEHVLGLYAHLAVAWVGAIVADLVIAKPLGLSPARLEFRRAYLYDINPSGFGAMLLASVGSIAAYVGAFGDGLRPASAGIALLTAVIASPLITVITRHRFFVARAPVDFGPRHRTVRCSICRNRFEAEDIAGCPAYGGAICSLCCTLDARCGDRCKPEAQAHEQLARWLEHWLPFGLTRPMLVRIGRFAMVFAGMGAVFGAMLWLLYTQEQMHPGELNGQLDALFAKTMAGLLLLAALAAWWLVLAHESRHVAQEESDRQTKLLMVEIDAHLRTDRLLQEAKELAESANQAKSRFLTGISHEMRSPLTSILGYSQLMLRDDRLADRHRGSIDTIHRNGEHLAGLVDGLLELSRIEAGKIALAPQVFDLGELLDQTARMFEPLAQEKRLAFAFVREGSLPARVRGDPKRVRQIVINLLGNAVKFTASGRVELRAGHAREIARIEVIDTGVGIASADQQRIFQPFERLSSVPGVEGIGLGLTITRLLVNMMGGDIRVDSASGAGSRFRVRLFLPAVQAADQAVMASEVVSYDGPLREVLIVDDNAEHRAVLRSMLGPLGFAIRETDGFDSGLAAILARPPDLVLLDINLGCQSGWTLLERLRAVGIVRPRVVMVSANAQENHPASAARHDYDGFVGKPVRHADLLESVGAALGLRWLRRSDVPPEAPDRDALRELLESSSRGHDRAFEARLLEIAAQSPAAEAWTVALRGLRGDRPALGRHLAEALRERDET